MATIASLLVAGTAASQKLPVDDEDSPAATEAPAPEAVPTSLPAITHLALDGSGWVGVAHLRPSDCTGGLCSSTTSAEGGGDLSLTFYFHPLVDDDAPLSLQPFLQRTSWLSIAAGVADYAGHVAEGAKLSLAGYPNPHLFLWSTLGLQHEQLRPHDDYWALPVGAGVGVRFGDTLLDVGWDVAPQQHVPATGGWVVPFWGGFEANVHSVLARRLRLDGSFALVWGGFTASTGATLFFGRRFSVGLALDGAHTVFLDDGLPYDRFAIAFQGVAWLSRRFGLSLTTSETTTWTHTFAATQADEVFFTLGLLTRPL